MLSYGQANAVVEVSKVLEKAAFHADTFREAADQLFHQHNDPFLIRAPAHDIPTALEILQTGGESERKVIAYSCTLFSQAPY